MTPRTTIDWCRFRTRAEPVEVARMLGPVFGVGSGLEHVLEVRPLPKGMHGFQQAAELRLFGETVVGRMDYGGESQRGWVLVDLPGEGCAWVNDWPLMQATIAALGGNLRRLDIALTTYAGEVTHEAILAAHAAGKFNSLRGGPERHLQQITSSDVYAGRTCYVGTRAGADLFLRCYEKGKQLAAKHAERLTHIDGVPVELIYRVEVEMKAVRRPIAVDAITRRDEYFAACYPFCGELLPRVAPASLPELRRREKCAELDAVASHIRRQYGSSIRSLLKAHGGDVQHVMGLIAGHAENPRLVGPLVAHADVRRAVAGTGAAAPSVYPSSVR